MPTENLGVRVRLGNKSRSLPFYPSVGSYQSAFRWHRYFATTFTAFSLQTKHFHKFKKNLFFQFYFKVAPL